MPLLWKTEKKATQKLKIELSYDPVIPVLVSYSKEIKLFPRDFYTSMFIEALFTVAKTEESIFKKWTSSKIIGAAVRVGIIYQVDVHNSK